MREKEKETRAKSLWTRYQNIQNLDVLLIGSFEMSNVSNALIGLQSERRVIRTQVV